MKYHLTGMQTTVSSEMVLATRPGMCAWAGSGPGGETCGTCAHWEGRAQHHVAYCGPGKRIIGRKAQKIPGDMAACRAFEKQRRS